MVARNGFAYDDVLQTIASCIGCLVKVDSKTTLATKEWFARVCVEVDLTKPLVGQFWLNQRWCKVEHEDLHSMCLSCRRYTILLIHVLFSLKIESFMIMAAMERRMVEVW